MPKFKELLGLKSHQERAVKFESEKFYSILALEMGLGKTFCALAAWNRNPKTKNLLIVCPAYLSLNWQGEILKIFGPSAKSRIYKSKVTDWKEYPIVIVSYDVARKTEALFEWADHVVIDEAHYLKSMDAARTKSIHKFIYENNVPRLTLLTGTPVKNSVTEYYSLLCLMNYDPRGARTNLLDAFEDQVAFSDTFANRVEFQIPIWKNGYRQNVTVVKWEGLKNVDRLKAYLKPFYLRISAKDALDLPPIVEKKILTSSVRDPKLLEDFDAYFEGEKADSVMSKYKAEAALRKVPLTVSYINDLVASGASPIVVYSDHVAPALELAKRLEAPCITGQTPIGKRHEISKTFQEGKVPILIATIKSFSTGVTLTRSNNMVFNDYPWVPGDLDQAIFRIKRMGQEKTCFIHYILGSPQDSLILERVAEKKEVITKIT